MQHQAAPVPADTSHRAMVGILADVRRRSFFFASGKGAGLTAGNYRQHLRATLDAGRYAVAADTAGQGGAAWQVDFALRGIGRDGTLALRPVATPTAPPALAEGHASYQQPGFAVDYDNTPTGLRQTYRLAARPAGSGPVQVALALTTHLHARPAGDTAVVFAVGSSPAPVLHYGSLRAWDATGRRLPATMHLAEQGTALALVVDDAGARYPLTIDPLASTAGTTLSGASAGDTFATSVALVGDLNGDGYADLAVGAPGYSGGAGAVYLYRGSSTGLATTAVTVLQGSGTDANGTSVAGAGDFNGDGYADLLAGAPGYASNAGVAFIYAGGPSFFTNPTANAAGIAGLPNSRGATSVAGVGDVNGDGYDDFAFGGPAYNVNVGSVFIVFGNASLSVNTNTATVGGGTNYRLGASLTGLGDTNGDGYADLAAGAPGTSAALIVQGANATDYPSFGRFYVQPSGGTTAGTSVAGPGDVNGDGYADILLGAPGAGTSGSVFLYLGGTSLSSSSSQAAVFSTAEPGENFGQAVCGTGDINGDGYADFAVGAPAYAANKGRVYVSLGKAVLSNISNVPPTYDGETAGDRFGSSLGGGDANGDGYADLLVGAPANSSSTGRVYAYYGSPAALLATPTATLTEPSPADGNAYGVRTASAGDVNGDGYDDVLVGAYLANGGKGRAYLYLGSSTGLATTPTVLDGPGSTNSYFGYSLVGAGDVNGDGYDDVLVSAFRANGGSGRAYLYLGSSAGLATTATTFSEPVSAPNNGFGSSVAGAGDVNGDGYADVLIGAYFSGSGQGRAYCYLGSSTGLATTPTTLSEPSAAAGNNFGNSLAGAGDVNGDGYADVLVGAQGPNDNSRQGRAYFYLGSRNGLVNTPSTALSEPSAVNGNNFGTSVASAGDVNGDGYSDVLVGAQGPNDGTRQGRAYFYPGNSAGLTATPTATLSEPSAVNGNYFGYSVSSAGDVNGDGYSDVLVGASGASSTNTGRAYYYLGSGTGLLTNPTTLSEPGAAAGTSFGLSVAGAGDVDGDGYSDVLTGASNPSGQGRAYLWRGNQAAARAGALRLYNANYTPISASNRSATQFGIGLTARNPAGRIQARVVWEVVRQGQAFSNASALPNSMAYSGRGAWTNLPASGTAPELRALVAKVGRTSKVRARLEYASSPLASGPTNGVGGPASRVRYGPWTYVAGQQLGLSTSAATPLPVVLTRFAATGPTGHGPAAVRLAWATASEQNSQAFEVERSTNGVAFATIGTVTAAGTSSTARAYELLDAKLPADAALLYYRLRQMDLDGTFSYSPVRTVALVGAATGVGLFPNPTTSGATLLGAQPGTAVTVYDALGRPVATATADASGTAALTLPVGLPAGVYLVRVGDKALKLTVE
ncbi:FG-GAP-like repeat-containing protein [Hymenobacter negativus]|uniref:FG-GAP repeat protein n=1 Tax=Hymenobacter negativus TaxID=2795026 RepID=A0ABS0Q757_9BACT|nr:FG-GAP-like repeat-containing protein [Hymenobacter negativus]MBH8558496.1 FG-GAP repeat protein [Hymenobacter negativus]